MPQVLCAIAYWYTLMFTIPGAPGCIPTSNESFIYFIVLIIKIVFFNLLSVCKANQNPRL